MKPKWSIGALLVCLLLAWGGWAAAEMPRQRSLYRITLDFATALPEEYAVLAGPVETYKWYRVNEWLRGSLAGYVEGKAAGPGARSATLRVKAEGLATGFRAIGAVAEVHPEQIVKTAVLRLRADLESEGRSLGQREVRGDARVVIGWQEGFTAWSYDYRDVIGEAIREAIGLLDAFVDEVAPRG